jgi:hypothetical protein
MFLPKCSWATIINHQIGALFGLGNSAVSRRARIFKTELPEGLAL